MTQFSLFGSEAAAVSLDDLDGLLVAGAQWVRSGASARLSVVVADRWRADALAAAFAERGVDGPDPVVAAAAGFAARTAFTADLVAAALRWTRGANRVVPKDFDLGAGAVRLWTIAAGRRDDAGFLLGCAGSDEPLHQLAGAALARLGVAAVSLARPHRAAGETRSTPGWRVTSQRRLRRLAELVGPPPAGGAGDWPSGARLR